MTPRQKRATREWSIYTGAIAVGLTRPHSAPDQYQSAAPAQVRPCLSLSHASADLLYEFSRPKCNYSRKTVQWLYCSILRLIGHDMLRLVSAVKNSSCVTKRIANSGSFCRYRKALYFLSLEISLLFGVVFFFLSFITFDLRNLFSGSHRRNPDSSREP